MLLHVSSWFSQSMLLHGRRFSARAASYCIQQWRRYARNDRFKYRGIISDGIVHTESVGNTDVDKCVHAMLSLSVA